MNGGRVSEQSRLMTGAVIGAVVGAAASYLFFTERGRGLRERMEPAVDDLRREFARFQKTVEKLGSMANEGMRVVNEFNAARTQSHFPSDRTSH
jgi:gas vesicle protein